MATHPKYNWQKFKAVETYLSRCEKKGECPTVEGCSKYLDVTVRTVSRWRNKYKSFRKAMLKLERDQKSVLIANALTRKWDSRFAQFLLAVNHDMVEAKKTVHDVEDNVVKRMKELHDIIEEPSDAGK